MDRHVLKVLFVAAALALAPGCLRNEFDLCAGDAPHPDCALLDAGPDAGPSDAGQLGQDASADTGT